MMRCIVGQVITHALLGLGLMLAAGCGDASDGGSAATQPPRAATPVMPDVAIPTQEEANARAAAEINEANADAIFRELEEEILGDEG